MSDLPKLCSMWIGDDLGPIGEVCLASFVAKGHPVTLYLYDEAKHVPAGVTVVDAATVLPRSRIIKHRQTGSLSLFGDLFRYELLRRSAGLWIDCDVFCLRPFVGLAETVCAYEDDGKVIGNSVFRLRPQSPTLDRLIALFDQPNPMPPWMSEPIMARLREANTAGARFDISHLPFASAGPRAITWFSKDDPEIRSCVLPRQTFYPLHWETAELLLTANFDLHQAFTPQTLAVHLWNYRLVASGLPIAKNSPIDRMISGTFSV